MNTENDHWTTITYFVYNQVDKFFNSNSQTDTWGYADKEDIKQEILLHLWKKKHLIKYVDGEIPMGFVKTVCRRQLLNWIRNCNYHEEKRDKPFTRNPEKFEFIAALNSGDLEPATEEVDYTPAFKFYNSLDDRQKAALEVKTPRHYKTRAEYDKLRKRAHVVRARYRNYLFINDSK